jgi:hypothetical protein
VSATQETAEGKVGQLPADVASEDFAERRAGGERSNTEVGVGDIRRPVGGVFAAREGLGSEGGPGEDVAVGVEMVARRLDRELVVKLAESGAAGRGVRLSLWDYGGQEAFHALHHLYLGRMCVYALIFSMEWLVPAAPAPAKEDGLRFLRFWLSAIHVHAVDRRKLARDRSVAPVMLVGTHKDKVPVWAGVGGPERG